jgi:twitching motility protein PilU
VAARSHSIASARPCRGASADQALFDLYEAGRISYKDALRFADSTNEVRLAIKLHGKEAKDKDLTKGIEHLDIV